MKKVTKKFDSFQQACEALAIIDVHKFREKFGLDEDFGYCGYSKTTITTGSDRVNGFQTAIVKIKYE